MGRLSLGERHAPHRCARAVHSASGAMLKARHDGLLNEFHSLGLDCVVIGDSTPRTIQRAFSDWAEARIANRRGEWR